MGVIFIHTYDLVIKCNEDPQANGYAVPYGIQSTAPYQQELS